MLRARSCLLSHSYEVNPPGCSQLSEATPIAHGTSLPYWPLLPERKRALNRHRIPPHRLPATLPSVVPGTLGSKATSKVYRFSLVLFWTTSRYSCKVWGSVYEAVWRDRGRVKGVQAQEGSAGVGADGDGFLPHTR